ncbi:hypothetical protein [Ferruginibacter sp.]
MFRRAEKIITVFIFLLMNACFSMQAAMADEPVLVEPKPSVLVFPPFDINAGRGISPGIQQWLQNEMAKDSAVTLIKFPYKKLMDVPYQNVFDKKYCKPVLEKIKADIIILSQLELVKETGNMQTDLWNVHLKIYQVHTGKQKDVLSLNNLTGDAIKEQLSTGYNTLQKQMQ